VTFTRYELTIPVELTSELHIGGVDEVPERDGEGTVIRFCRNGLKEPTIPGRSIRGAVRAACDIARQAMKDTGDPATQNGEAFSKENWISLWGDDTDYTGKSLLDRRLRSDDSLPIRQSALTFHAVSFPEYKDSDSGGCSPLPRRHGVGIDRTTGAASDGALYEHEFLPRGTKFDIRITAEGRDDETMGRDQSEGIPGSASSEVIELLLHLIRSLFESEAISLGGRTGSGQGCIKVQGSKEERQDSAKQYLRIVAQSKGIEGKKPVDIVDALTGALSEGPESSKGTDSSAWAGSKPAHIKIKWWSPTGIFVAEDEKLTKRRKEEAQKKNPEANGVTEPLRDPSVPWDEAQLLIPGTSIRGALRSRASRIARTVLAAEAENKLTPFTSHDVHEQIAAEPNLVRYMFGCTEYRGAITVHDCRSKKRGTRVEVTHNVIDRWTGGVIDGGLFTEAVYLGTHWEPITIDIDLRQLLNNIEAEKGPEDREQSNPTHADYAHAAYVLLGLVLAELSAGTLPLGSRSTRGLGQVVVSSIDVRGCTRDDVVIPAKTLSGGDALKHPRTAASRPTQDRYDAQRKLAGNVLEYLREKIKGAKNWSERLENSPGTARPQSEGMGNGND
jgi:hypothetical protein avisC_11510